MHTVEITLEQVLLARDRRVLRQRELAARYGGTLLSFTMNIAGPVKDAPLVRLAFQAGLAALDRDLGQPLHRELIQAPTGPEALLVYDRPAPWVKERCLLLEEREAVGRLYDLDVLSPEGEKLSRPQSRRCLICGGPVTVCSRSRAHGLAAIRARTRDILADFAAGHLSALARQALEDEVDLTPKPGLVDRRNTGAHDDMDRPLFHRSAGALTPYLPLCVPGHGRGLASGAAEPGPSGGACHAGRHRRRQHPQGGAVQLCPAAVGPGPVPGGGRRPL
ncbi:MAG: citrate lyase holo-[acyl-carrier protein] synthase [Oscillospiraceae bacterium]